MSIDHFTNDERAHLLDAIDYKMWHRLSGTDMYERRDLMTAAIKLFWKPGDWLFNKARLDEYRRELVKANDEIDERRFA